MGGRGSSDDDRQFKGVHAASERRAEPSDDASAVRLGRFYALCRRQAHAVASAILLDNDEAFDAVQEAFIKVLRHRERFERIEDPLPWLRRIVANICIDRLRKRQVAQRCLSGRAWGDSRLQADEFEPHRALDTGRMRVALADAIDQLSQEHRDVVVMREFDGMSYDSIAVRCDCPRGTVMSRLFYARRRLRELLGPTLGRRSAA